MGGHRATLRSPGRGHGPEPVHEGGSLHVHADRHGFLGVLGDRRYPDCWPLALLRVSVGSVWSMYFRQHLKCVDCFVRPREKGSQHPSSMTPLQTVITSLRTETQGSDEK